MKNHIMLLLSPTCKDITSCMYVCRYKIVLQKQQTCFCLTVNSIANRSLSIRVELVKTNPFESCFEYKPRAIQGQ